MTDDPRPGSRRHRLERRRSPVVAFGAFALVVVLAGVGYFAFAWHRSRDERARAPGVELATAAEGRSFAARPHLLVRSTARGDGYGRVALVPADATRGPRALTGLHCDRLDFAGGRGLCLSVHRGAFTSSTATVFDSRLRAGRHFTLPGIASRTRVAPDGSVAATTTFVSGDSYASTSFSTRTSIWDLRTGRSLGDLEQFRVTNGGDVVDTVDRNYWGITFGADSNTFYATLATAGRTYLIQGDLAHHRAHVLRPDVECPALSPDGTRIAYKHREGGQVDTVRWRLHVLDLRTGEDHALAERRSVDDQAQWLDGATVAYDLPVAGTGGAASDVWAVPADGSGTPRLVAQGAASPAIVATAAGSR